MTNKTMLDIQGIDVYRGNTHVLRDVSMSVEQGEIVALIGANGAGKTTTLRTISGLLRPSSGTLEYNPNGEAEILNLGSMQAENIVAAGLCHCPEGRGVFSRLTVRENLLMGAYLRDDNEGIRRDMQRVNDMFPILADRKTQLAGSLSGGEQMMLAVGRALMSNPKMLMLDEPSLGLAPLVVEAIFKLLADINKQGVTILLVEQNAVMALELSNRAYVLETGRVVMHGDSKELACDDNVRKAYLGG